MKKLHCYPLIALLTGLVFVTACESTFTDDPLQDTSILPDELTVEIPSALTADVTMHKGAAAVDTLKGAEIYGHLRFFIHAGNNAARVTRSVIHSIRRYNIDRVKSVVYESDDDGRLKELIVVEGPEFEGVVWEYGLTITDVEAQDEEGDGTAMQVFWNHRNPKKGITIINPYNLDRTNDHRWATAMYRIDYSGEGEMGYGRRMIVSISDLPAIDPLLAPFAMDAMKMFVGKTGDQVDVFGNSSHPNAKFLTEKVGYNWAFVASASAEQNIAVVELGLPLSTVDSEDRVVLLERNSVYNVLFNEVLTVWPHASEELLDAWLTNAAAPGFFDRSGFIQGGEVPGDEFSPLMENIALLTPYNPVDIASLEIQFGW